MIGAKSKAQLFQAVQRLNLKDERNCPNMKEIRYAQPTSVISFPTQREKNN